MECNPIDKTFSKLLYQSWEMIVTCRTNEKKMPANGDREEEFEELEEVSN